MAEPFGDNDMVPEPLRAALEEALKGVGISDAYMVEFDSLGKCEFGPNGERQDMFWGTFSNVLRQTFLGGAFKVALRHASSIVATSDMQGFMASEPLSMEVWEVYTHLGMHVIEHLFETVARDAIEPYVAALYASGKYQPNESGIDFLCVAAANEGESGAHGND
jgi:hypothetical protein